MPGVWLLWEKTRLLGVYTSQNVAEDEADIRRSGIASALGRHGVEVRTERWEIVHYSIRDADERSEIRAKVAAAVEQWPVDDDEAVLLPVQEATWRRYLAVPVNGQLRFPLFQFQSPGIPLEGFGEVLTVLRSAGWSDSQILLRFTSSQAGLDGRIPAELLRRSPDDVIGAARASI